jgi:hypothetical protein
MTANHRFEILGPVRGSLMRRTPFHPGPLDNSARIAEESYSARGRFFTRQIREAGPTSRIPAPGSPFEQPRYGRNRSTFPKPSLPAEIVTTVHFGTSLGPTPPMIVHEPRFRRPASAISFLNHSTGFGQLRFRVQVTTASADRALLDNQALRFD